jgi:hypothetical protein
MVPGSLGWPGVRMASVEEDLPLEMQSPAAAGSVRRRIAEKAWFREDMFPERQGLQPQVV